jgi:hypothetical protein
VSGSCLKIATECSASWDWNLTTATQDDLLVLEGPHRASKLWSERSQTVFFLDYDSTLHREGSEGLLSESIYIWSASCESYTDCMADFDHTGSPVRKNVLTG